MDYFRHGYLSFTCSINNDLRGLKLDLNYISVFPSSDCYDRGACLFSYQYENVESCESIGTRLELRFRRSGTKQPTFIAMQCLETQYIREAIWFLQHGKYLDVSLRERAIACFSALSPEKARQSSTSSSSSVAASRRQNGLTYFEDEAAIQQRIETRCRVMGCQRHSEAADFSHASEILTSNMLSQSVLSHSSRGLSTTRAGNDRLCEEHARAAESPRSPSKRGAFFTRDRSKSSLSASSLIHSAHYSRMLRYQSPLLKKSGVKKYHLSKLWNVKYVAVFETPVGGFLCYYDKLSHCPGVAETPKERRVIDLSSVICIRPESSATNAPTTSYAFDIVTIYRTWTFAATGPEGYEVWLKVLTDAVEKHTSMAPDKRLKFPVKMMTTAQASQYQLTRHESTTLEISSYGVCVCSGYEGEIEIYSWYFTEIQKWSVVYQQGEACCLLNCLSATSKPVSGSTTHAQTAALPPYHEFLLQSSEAAAICQAIEFYVGKCMAKLEVLAVGIKETANLNRARRGSGELSTLGGVPELVRFRSEQIMKTSPMPITQNSAKNDGKVPQASPNQHVISAIPLKPVGRFDAGINRPVIANAKDDLREQPTQASTASPQSAKGSTESGIRGAAACKLQEDARQPVSSDIDASGEHQRPTESKPGPGFPSCESSPRTSAASDARQPKPSLVAQVASRIENDAAVDVVLQASADHSDAQSSTCYDGQMPAAVMTSDERPHTEDDENDNGDDDSLPYLELSPSSLSGLDIDMAHQSPVPIVDLSASPVPLLESPLFSRPGRFDSSFSDGGEDGALPCENGAEDAKDEDDNDSDRFESFGYLICDVFEASDAIDDELIVAAAAASSDDAAVDQLETQCDSEEGRNNHSQLSGAEGAQDCDGDATEAAQDTE